MRRSIQWLCFAGLAAAAVGCGKNPAYEGEPRISLSGRVTLDGAPIDGGTISFVPQLPGKRVAGGPIVNGSYTIPENQGVHVGQYRVEIRCQKPTGKKYKDPDTGELVDVTKESVPPKFNIQSSLSASVKEEQPALDFDLKSR